MIIFPAIDLINGECVRLTRGDYNLKKKYSSDPVSIAMAWQDCGADWLHIVDLDGAKTGKLKNLEVAEDIKKKTGLKIQYGGGIREIQSVDMVLNAGIDRAILGTSAIEDVNFLSAVVRKYKSRFILSLDFDSSGRIYKHGWQSGTDFNIYNYLSVLAGTGIEELILTNISKDGTLTGIDAEMIEKIIRLSSFKFIIAGGVSSIEDVIKLKELETEGVSGVIIGKALYEESINLKNAIKIAEGKEF